MLWRRPEIAVDVVQQYKSDTDYSDDSGSEEDEEEDEDDISMCSGSTISAGGQSCTVADLSSTASDEAYSDGTLLALHCTVSKAASIALNNAYPFILLCH